MHDDKRIEQHFADLLWLAQSAHSAHGLRSAGVEPSTASGVHDHEAQWRLMDRVVDMGPHVRRWRRIVVALERVPSDMRRDIMGALAPWNYDWALGQRARWRSVVVAHLVIEMGARACGTDYASFRETCVMSAQAGGSRVLNECVERTRKRLEECLSAYVQSAEPIRVEREDAESWKGKTYRLYGES